MAYTPNSATSAGIRPDEPNAAGGGDTLRWFSEKVAKRFDGIRIVRVPSPDDCIVRFLVAPADRFKDELLPAQRARQVDAGALPPEVYGHDLFELVKGNVVRLRDGSRIPLSSPDSLRSVLSRFLDPESFDGRQLAQIVERIREGQNAARKSSSIACI
jgi:hypothetical protein